MPRERRQEDAAGSGESQSSGVSAAFRYLVGRLKHSKGFFYACLSSRDTWSLPTSGLVRTVYEALKAVDALHAAWARDLPMEVHIKAVQKTAQVLQPVVTAPSAAHLYCMRLLQQDGDLESAVSPPSNEVGVCGLPDCPKFANIVDRFRNKSLVTWHCF